MPSKHDFLTGLFTRSVTLANRCDKDLKSIASRVLNGNIECMWPLPTKSEANGSDSESRSLLHQGESDQHEQRQQRNPMLLLQQQQYLLHHHQQQQQHRQQHQSMATPVFPGFLNVRDDVSAQILLSIRKEIEQLRCISCCYCCCRCCSLRRGC